MSRKRLTAKQIKHLFSKLEKGEYVSLANIPYSQHKDLRRPVISVSETPPLCVCGCGQQVKAHRGTWNWYVRGHQPKPSMGKAARKKLSRNMKKKNPMHNKATAEKVAEKLRGKPAGHTQQGKANIAAAARKRMLSDANPMKDQKTFQKTMRKILSRQQPSKNEIRFMDWLDQVKIDLEFVGLGTLWLGRCNPDFRVPGQKKVVELSQPEVFTNKRTARTVESYGVPKVEHCLKKNWNCLVIFVKDRQRLTDELKAVLQNFVLTESNWSGVWDSKKLIQYSPSMSE